MEELDQIEGCNPVIEALRAGRPLQKILIAREVSGALGAAIGAARAAGLPIVHTEQRILDRMAKTRNHQGIIAIASARAYADLDEMVKNAAARSRIPFLLLLDGVMDPQNLGGLARTAEAMGVDGIILPERRAVGLTATVEHCSAGALEYLPVARVTNLTRTMIELKERGYWSIGAEAGTGEYKLPKLDRPVALVLGGEGSGLHRLVKEECDFLISLPMYGRINSLNVSVAGAILMSEIARKIRG